jgi:hypothetical protein
MSIRSHARLAVCAALLASGAAASPESEAFTLQGTWTMTAAYEIHSDGTRTTNYGEHPAGLLLVDPDGRYSLQIFRPGRAKFASRDKTHGSAEEYREALLGSSTHFGHVALDAAKHQLVFRIEASSYPNWENTQQVRDYTFENGVLSYSVPASASGNGTVAYSVWERAGR